MSTWARSSNPWGKQLVLDPRYIGGHQVKILGRTLVSAPQILTFFDERYTEFFVFIRAVEALAVDGRVLIDLSRVREVKAAALLVLYSSIEIAQIKSGDKQRVAFTYSNCRPVAQSFKRFGLWRLTGQLGFMPNAGDSAGLEVCTASREATRAGDNSQLRRVIDYTQQMVLEGSSNEEADLIAYNAITESVSNVWQHAYDDDFFEGGVDSRLAHWWIIVERIKDQFYIAVYDKGAGIPFTLQKKPWYRVALVNEQGNIQHDIAMDALRIKMAVEYGRSRFKVDNRGKGLSEAKDFVQLNPRGTMIIYSGYGDYTYYADTRKDELRNLPSNFGGTLIQWNLQLERTV